MAPIVDAAAASAATARIPSLQSGVRSSSQAPAHTCAPHNPERHDAANLPTRHQHWLKGQTRPAPPPPTNRHRLSGQVPPVSTHTPMLRAPAHTSAALVPPNPRQLPPPWQRPQPPPPPPPQPQPQPQPPPRHSSQGMPSLQEHDACAQAEAAAATHSRLGLLLAEGVGVVQKEEHVFASVGEAQAWGQHPR